MAASATFALKAGVWFRRGRLLMVSPDSLGTACPLSGRNSTYRPVQISGAGSQILTARVFYLQSGRPGDRYITNPSAPRIFVEVPDTGVRGHWDKLFHKRVAKHMRAKGLGRQQAKSAAAQAIQEM